jgi:hypothetical protein
MNDQGWPSKAADQFAEGDDEMKGGRWFLRQHGRS